MTKTLYGGSAIAAALLVSLTLYTDSSFAESPSLSPEQRDPKQKSDPPATPTPVHPALDAANTTTSKIVHDASRSAAAEINNPLDLGTAINLNPQPPARPFVATAYNLRGRTASGKSVRRGIIAADRRMLPIGTRVRLDAGAYSGEYLVADTGGAVRGRKIDIWVPRYTEARRFGRRKVKLTVLGYSRKGKRLTANAHPE